MKDLNARIQQLTKLILTSQTVDETKGDESRPASPSKVDFDMSPYQVSTRVVPTYRVQPINTICSSNKSSSLLDVK